MQIINKIKLILKEPTKFFKNLKSEQGIKTAFIYLAILLLISTILSWIVGQFTIDFYTDFLSQLTGEESTPNNMTPIFNYIIGLGFTFISVGLLHIWILIFGGKESYTKTYQLSIYSSTPTFLLGWIPVFNLLVMVWSLVLLIIGTQHVHKISRKKAILMYVIPYGIFFLLAIIGLIALTLSQGTGPIVGQALANLIN